MIWLATLPIAARASEQPDAEAPAEVDEDPPPRRFTNGGVALGLTQLAVTGADGTGLRYGVSFGGRTESPLSERFQLNVLASVGVTNPAGTVAVASAAVDVGAWSVGAFQDVTAWVAAGRGRDDQPLRVVGATFAYTGLAMTFAAVPALLIVSPFAAAGHAVVGPTVSFHSDARAPNLFVELGAGASLWGDPVDGVPILGWGPIVGVGVQTERNSIALHALISPPVFHAAGPGAPDTMVTGELVVGF